MTKFFRGGGTRANTISEVPERIDGMLRNYKKVAMGTTVINFKLNDSNLLQRINSNGHCTLKTGIKVPLNLDFTPTKIYIYMEKILLGTEYHTGIDNGVGASGISKIPCFYIETFNSKELIFNMKVLTTHVNQIKVDDCRWIAIE